MLTFGKDIAKTAKKVPNQLNKPMDNSIFIIVFMLTCFGLIMIWSASMYNAKLEGDEFLYVMNQLKYAVIGFSLMWIVSLIDYRFIKKYATLLMGIIIIMLLIVAAAGVIVNGAGRWLSFGNYVIQPSEFAKIAVIIFLAAVIERRYDLIKEFKSFFLLLVFLWDYRSSNCFPTGFKYRSGSGRSKYRYVFFSGRKIDLYLGHDHNFRNWYIFLHHKH